ncbi:MAG: DUF2236 domain-containing protein [Roseivirga sp.]|nr:DUF2236 domain-containing protein [Roseivirga sp.]
MKFFVKHNSVVRTIWGKSDTVLLIFAGASAEFALNKAVDWLYFTGRLPSDPIGRLFSTVAYARSIVFSDQLSALRTIDSMAHIHSKVEEKRGEKIPQWAFRDVLYMLIDYSIRSFEVLERRLTQSEKQEVFGTFYQVGSRMGIHDLPDTFQQWQKSRIQHISSNLQRSHYTDHLFGQYRKELGAVRYRILLEAQILVMHQNIHELLGFRKISHLAPFIPLYKLFRLVKADRLLKALLLPGKYKSQINALDKPVPPMV